jgi:large subunit ribosomal protein L23
MNIETLQRFRQVLRRPLFTEKAHFDQERRNAFHFEVAREANKVEIRRAVEALFGVRVVSVNTMRRRGKDVRRGFTPGTRPDVKRAIVTLRPGQTIEYA